MVILAKLRENNFDFDEFSKSKIAQTLNSANFKMGKCEFMPIFRPQIFYFE